MAPTRESYGGEYFRGGYSSDDEYPEIEVLKDVLRRLRTMVRSAKKGPTEWVGNYTRPLAEVIADLEELENYLEEEQ